MKPLTDPCPASDPEKPTRCQNMDTGRKYLLCVKCDTVRHYERCSEIGLDCVLGRGDFCVGCENLMESK